MQINNKINKLCTEFVYLFNNAKMMIKNREYQSYDNKRFW